ncbi:MAG: glycosyltransferase family A protein [Bdellovibrionota bacterium]
MSQPKIKAFVMCYNRPKYLAESLDSLLNQSYQNIEIIVSDNSTSNSCNEVLKNYASNSQIKIIRRCPSLPALEHFNILLKEAADSQYFMIFHDDDVLKKEALEKMILEFQNPNVVAVSCNAFKLYNNRLSQELFIQDKTTITISQPEELIRRYLKPFPGHAPFPSYLYNSSAVQNISLSKKRGGKHSDLIFLLDLISNGKLVMLSEPLMSYRIHSGNDSNTHDLRSTFSLIRKIKKYSISTHLINEFKFKFLLKYYLQNKKKASIVLNWKLGILFKSTLAYFATHPLVLIRVITNKIKRIESR